MPTSTAPTVAAHARPTLITDAAAKAKLSTKSSKNPLVKWKVAHVDRRNQNGRIYTRPLFERIIRDAKATDAAGKNRLDRGELPGRLDHPSIVSQGALGSVGAVWRDLWLEDDGAVFAVAELIIDTEPGRHVHSLVANGVACGASLSGRGNGRRPTSAERVTYNLPDAEDEEDAYLDAGTHPTVIYDDSEACAYRLISVDFVDDPAVGDAMNARDAADPSPLLLDSVKPPEPTPSRPAAPLRPFPKRSEEPAAVNRDRPFEPFPRKAETPPPTTGDADPLRPFPSPVPTF